MSAVEFVDTNILVYAHDLDAGRKQGVAAALVLRLMEKGTIGLSTQVLAEFFVNVTRKLKRPLPSQRAAEIVRDFGAWPLVRPDHSDIVAAIEIADRNHIHFWDALVVRAAATLDARVLWTEDLNHGQIYEGVRARDPFRQQARRPPRRGARAKAEPTES